MLARQRCKASMNPEKLYFYKKNLIISISKLIFQCSPLDVEIIPNLVIFPFFQMVRKQWFSEVYQENLRSFLSSCMKGEIGTFYGFFRG
jgi:hypothetical protein